MASASNDQSCPVTRSRGALSKNRSEEFVNSGMTEGITIFTGEDIAYSSTKWAQDIEDNAEIFTWTAQQKLIIARRSLAGTAELWLRSEKPFKTYEELKTALQREFPDSVNMKEMHEIMTRRKKLKHESCYQYMLIMKELGKRAKFPDCVVIQYIIDGIPDYEQNKAILYGATSFSILKERLDIYEKIQHKIKQQRERVMSSEKPIKPKAGYSRASPQRCYKCGEKGHMANQCTKDVKCFKCNSYGHIGIHCTQGQDQDDTRKVRGVNLYSLEASANGVKPDSSPFNQENTLEVSANGVITHQNTHLSMSTRDNSDNVNNNNIFSIGNSSVNTNNKCVISVKMQNQWFKCLLDTGSDVNLVSVDLYKSLNVNKCSEENVNLIGLGHYTTRSVGKFFTNVIVDGFNYYTHFYIVPQGVIPYNIILGQPFLASTILTIDKGTVIVRPISYDSSYLNCLPTNTEADNISNEPEVQSLIYNYKPNKIKEAPIKMRIVLKNEIPVVQRPRRLALKEEEIVKKQIDEWLEKGIIRPSYSEYSSPLVLVPKKDGTIRVCVDYRKLNQKMVKDEYPLPIIEDQIDKLSKVTVFSTLDLKNAFFHLPIEEDSIKFTAFVTTSPEGQYEFLRAPFGLSICPKYFMRYINIIFREFIARGSVLIFLDDLILLAQSEQEGLTLLRQVLSVAADYGLEIIKKTHGNGHFGKTKIKYLIEKDYYIKGLDKKVEKVILNCIPCVLASRKSGKKEGFLNPIDKGDLPLQTLHCDHLGPLDSTKKMYNYILTVMDAYTKFVWIHPTKSTTSKETVDKLKLHQQDFGNPSRIITDRGTAFTGKEFIEYCDNENIEHIKITTGVPRGNGQVERMNKIIISVLSKMCIREPANWYKYVSKLQRAINGTYQRSINTSPFELLLGTTLRSKEDLNIIELLQEENRRLFTEKRDELRKEAKQHILKIQEENRKSFNKRRKEGYQYKAGDLVAIQRTQFGPNLKIKPKFFGPYQIIKKLGKDRYEVHKVNNNTEGPKKTTTAVDYIKKWPYEMTIS